ncbi:MAG: DoxX family protein [Bacteroidales bacterium]|nr:DoxX family protein [Bacteroidales bacterium]
MIYKFLFPQYNNAKLSGILLIARVLFGGLLFYHGFMKIMDLNALEFTFPDPFGIGSPASLWLVIFAEVFCALACIFGFLFRLALIPIIFSMGVALFVIHSGDPFSVKELALVYFIVFVILYITGPGEYAIDRWFSRAKQDKEPE